MASSIDSSSTDAEVWASYDDNASYEEDGSRAKALAFITACRIILRRRPAATGRGEQSISFESIKSEMDMCRRWISMTPGSSSRPNTRFGSFNDFRD